MLRRIYKAKKRAMTTLNKNLADKLLWLIEDFLDKVKLNKKHNFHGCAIDSRSDGGVIKSPMPKV